MPIKKATDIFDITKLEIPEKINGYNVSISSIIDNDTFLIVLYDDENSITDTGFLRLSDNSYTSFKEIGDNYALCAYNDKYIVYKIYDGDFTKKAEDESVKLFLFDISSKESKLIFTYSFDRELELSHYINNIALTKDSVYFDDIINNYQQAVLYKYDIEAETVSEVIKDAQNPFLFNDEIIFMRLKDGDYHNMSSLSGEFDFDMDFNCSDIRVGNSIISIDAISLDDDLKETTWGLNDWDYYSSNNHEYVLTTTRTISGLVCGGDFAAFTDYNDGVCPVIYNSKTEEFIAFDEINESAWWLLNDNYGILTTSKEHYLFSIKA